MPNSWWPDEPGRVTSPTHSAEESCPRFAQAATAWKIMPLDRVVEWVRWWREDRKHRVVFTNGVFDLLHPGHIEVLEQASLQGHHLVVGINDDASVQKPGRPIFPVEVRARMIAALETVDMVVVYSDATPLAVIEALRPDVLVKGDDYTMETTVGAALVPQVFHVKRLPGWSTTSVLQRIHTAMATRHSERSPSPYTLDDDAGFGALRKRQ